MDHGVSVMTVDAPAAAVPAVRDRVAIAGIFMAALVPLFTTPMLPFIDFYNHVARYYVLAELGDNALLRQNYASNWSILPNIGLDVLGTGLLSVVPVAVAAHLIVALIFAVQYFGVLAFNRALTGKTSPLVALLVVPLLYSWILNWGFANFLLGLGLVFAAAAWWVARRERPLAALPVAALLAVVIFFTHGVAFALYGILIGGLELGFFLAAPNRNAFDLARRLGLCAVQAVIPAWLFSRAATAGSELGLTNADESFARLRASGGIGDRLAELAAYRIETIVRVAEGPSFAFDAVMLAATLALVGALFYWRSLRVAAPAWPALAAGAVFVALCPPALFGVGYIADRMPLFVAMLAVGSVAVAAPPPRAVLGGLAALVAIRLGAIALSWQPYAHDYAEFQSVAALIPPGQLVNDVIVSGSYHGDGRPRCQMYRPLLVSHHGEIGGLFANETQQPLRLTGPLKAALGQLPRGAARGDPRPGHYDDVIAAAGPAGFRYLLVCNADLLTRPLPADVEVLARTPRFLLLRTAQGLGGTSPMVSRTR